MNEFELEIEHLCEVMHDAYEKSAKINGWSTNPSTRTSWDELPAENKVTMREAVRALVLDQTARGQFGSAMAEGARGYWLAFYHDWSAFAVCRTEVQALRYASVRQMTVEWRAWGEGH